MMIRTALSDEARNELIAFCADNLKSGLDAETYANGLEDETDLSGNVVFEIRGLHSRTGNPATISFNKDSNFRTESVE